MKHMKHILIGAFALALAVPVFAQDASVALNASAKAMGVSDLRSIEFSGSGSSYNFGQAVSASQPWPRFVLRSYKADIDYAKPAWRQEMDRTQPDGSAPFGGFRNIQLLSGADAWNVGANDMPAAAPANVTERQLQIWLTPAGFIKGALANNATMKKQGANTVVTFMTPDKHTVTGTIDAQNMVTKVETAIDNPVLGDMPWVATYSDYKSFGSVKFPAKIVQTQGGHPFLDLTVTDVKPNAAVAIDTPQSVKNAQLPPVKVETVKVGDGVWYLMGGTHHSVVVEFTDYVVVVEGPLNEERSDAVIAETHKLAPNKPIRYLINTHNHFDHLGGVRTFVAAGATIITPSVNKEYYERIFAAPHTLSPDKLALSKKKAVVEGVATSRVITDGKQTIDVYVQPLAGHNDAMILVYLPNQKLLVEADAWTPPAGNAPPPPGPPNPFTVQLYDEVEKLKIDVKQIAALHGPGLRPIEDLKKAAGKG